jgi:hypothetical protein
LGVGLDLHERPTPVILGPYAMRSPYRGLTRRVLPLLGLLLFPLAGCGHPATEAECEVILERIVDLELKAQNVTDPAEVSKRKNESLGLAGSGRSPRDVYEGCVGKHITDRAMQCVRNASTAQEVTDTCLK